MPNTVRPRGASYDIKTVKLVRKTGVKSENFFLRIFPAVFAQKVSYNRLLVYLVPDLSNPGQYKFFSYSLLDGKSTQLIDNSFSPPIDFTLSPQGFLVFYSGKTLYKFDLNNRLLEIINSKEACEKMCPYPYEGPYPPSISPDGNNIAFFRGYSLIVQSLTEGKPVSYVLPSNTLKNNIIWSDDGRFIYVKTVRPVGGFSFRYPYVS